MNKNDRLLKRGFIITDQASFFLGADHLQPQTDVTEAVLWMSRTQYL